MISLDAILQAFQNIELNEVDFEANIKTEKSGFWKVADEINCNNSFIERKYLQFIYENNFKVN
jgi:hypothetical protein